MHFLSILKIFSKLLLFSFIILAFSYYTGLYRWIDINIFKETGKDFTGKYIFHEDWSILSTVANKFDYSWLYDSQDPILIAHALGASGSHRQNTLTEMRKSLNNGFKLLEIDLWLDRDNVVRCHHGPNSPIPLQINDCTFDKALKFAFKNNFWLILDIKTDFFFTSQEILKNINYNDSNRIIFQLYKPQHIQLFKQWHQEKPLAGPIITTYLSKRSIYHIHRNMLHSEFKVLTIPSHRLNLNFKITDDSIKIFSHPTHSCQDFLNQRVFGVSGFYVTSDMAQKIERECIQ